MSSFFDFSKSKQDVRKRVGMPAKIEESLEEEDDSVPGLSESWVELAPPSRGSLCSSVDASLVLVEDFRDKDSRLSPVSVQSPHMEFDNLEQVKYKLVREMLPPGRNTDWYWDWSSRPEAFFQKIQRGIRRQYGSNLTTPPNSPEPPQHFSAYVEAESLFSARVMFGFLVSNIFTFVVGAALGFAVCKKFSKHRQI
ncbi:unnamed protein product [Caenorhabditis auriculariae]|uniref:BNIP3-like protein n=1 Tax=Caenorhabditis auriculariae TaxID=2777116 RepID=A0A8S1GZV2_9PELO|nr:unnamed protein product [Caenorhabditis auriculariae]